MSLTVLAKRDFQRGIFRSKHLKVHFSSGCYRIDHSAGPQINVLSFLDGNNLYKLAVKEIVFMHVSIKIK